MIFTAKAIYLPCTNSAQTANLRRCARVHIDGWREMALRLVEFTMRLHTVLLWLSAIAANGKLEAEGACQTLIARHGGSFKNEVNAKGIGR